MGIGQDQVNLLSSIHTVLRRPVESGEIEKTEDEQFQLKTTEWAGRLMLFLGSTF